MMFIMLMFIGKHQKFRNERIVLRDLTKTMLLAFCLAAFIFLGLPKKGENAIKTKD